MALADGETAVVTAKTADSVTLFYCVEYEEEDGTTGTLCKVGIGDFRGKCYDKVEVGATLLSDCREYGQLQTQEADRLLPSRSDRWPVHRIPLNDTLPYGPAGVGMEVGDALPTCACSQTGRNMMKMLERSRPSPADSGPSWAAAGRSS